MRTPSAPRSNQKRRTSSCSVRTRGSPQFRSGCSAANRCRYHSPGVPSGLSVRVHAGPPKIDCQSFGGRSPPSPRPGRNQNRPRSVRARTLLHRLDEPPVPVGDVVGDDVDDDPDAQGVGLDDQLLGVGQRPEQRVDRPVVRHVVPGVGLRRGVPGVEPDGVHPEVRQVRQVRADAGQVADPVAVPVGEAARIDLVDGGRAPPRGGLLRSAGVHRDLLSVMERRALGSG